MMEAATMALWEEYSRTKDPQLKRQLVMEYVGVVKYVVSKFRSYFRQSTSIIGEQDLQQVGMMGLLDSIERFDPTRGVKFETYAITRIRGTIQDELRKLDWIPRSVREKVRTLDRVTQKVECSDVVSSSITKIAGDLSLSVDEYMDLLQDTRRATPEVLSRGENGEDVMENMPSDDVDVADAVGNEQIKSILIKMIENLTQQDRLVISLYYYEELTFKEIAKILKLSESRVFQKHAVILERMREQAGELV
jgi:RNA polymerase sigma factor FliA